MLQNNKGAISLKALIKRSEPQKNKLIQHQTLHFVGGHRGHVFDVRSIAVADTSGKNETSPAPC
jgi:hypothetical protein